MSEQELRVPSIYTVPLIWLIIGAIFFSALIHLERELILLCACFFGIVGLCKGWSRLSARHLELETDLDRRRLFPGETASLTVTATNRKFLPLWLNLSIPIRKDGGISCESGSSGFDAALLWYRSAVFEWKLRLHKRGVYNLGPENMLTGDLLGLFPRMTNSFAARELIVYPRLIPVRDMAIPKTELFGAPGSKSPVTDPVYITGTRDYQAGSPARFINWRASARHGKLQEKVFEPSAREKALLVLDTRGFSDACDEAGFEHALELIGSMSVDFDKRGMEAGFLSNGMIEGKGPYASVGAGPRRAVHVLETLARLKMRPLYSIDKLFQDSGSRSNATVFILFCRQVDPEILSLRRLLDKTGKKVLIVERDKIDPLEKGTHEGIYSMDELRGRSDS